MPGDRSVCWGYAVWCWPAAYGSPCTATGEQPSLSAGPLATKGGRAAAVGLGAQPPLLRSHTVQPPQSKRCQPPLSLAGYDSSHVYALPAAAPHLLVPALLTVHCDPRFQRHSATADRGSGSDFKRAAAQPGSGDSSTTARQPSFSRCSCVRLSCYSSLLGCCPLPRALTRTNRRSEPSLSLLSVQYSAARLLPCAAIQQRPRRRLSIGAARSLRLPLVLLPALSHLPPLPPFIPRTALQSPGPAVLADRQPHPGHARLPPRLLLLYRLHLRTLQP